MAARIRLGNVPRFYGVAQVRAFVAECLGIAEDRVIVRKGPKWDHALVSVRDAGAADGAQPDLAPFRDTLDGASWKKAKLTATLVEDSGESRRENVREAVPRTHINDQVASLWRVPYAEQLSRKAAALRAVLAPYCTSDVISAPVASPQTEGYRNKCEFSVGTGPDGMPTVGFQMGAFRDGHVRVYAPDECPHVPAVLKDAAARLQAVVRAAPAGLVPYDRATKTGFWRLMLGRVHDDAVMLMVQVDPAGLSAAEGVSLSDVEEMLRGGLGGLPGLESLSMQQCSSMHLGVDPDAAPVLLMGAPRVTQTLRCGPRPLSFAISPLSFFQVNIPATERLYALVRDYVTGAHSADAPNSPVVDANASTDPVSVVDGNVSSNVSADTVSVGDATVEKIAENGSEDCTEPPAKRACVVPEPKGSGNDAAPIVLDLCCGTGTIGMVLADAAAAVRGVELVASAVEDARENARINGIANIAFECGRVEQVIAALIRDVEAMDACGDGGTMRPVVVVLDPPRAGVHASVVRAVRACPRVSRVVYVACNARAAAEANFGELTRAQSRALTGAPFRITRACPVDLFPHTEHAELVVSFDRASH